MALQLTPWQSTPSHPVLTADSVHLWRFPLTGNTSIDHLLNTEEQQRARRLRAPEKARAFVVARARLRQILAAYLAVDPKTLRFTYGPSGKPALAGADAPVFNLAHSGQWGLCAVIKQGKVGVDIETINPDLDYAKLAERFFSMAEKEWLSARPLWRRRRCFYRLWTRKEAWLKAKGGGFSDPEQDLGSVHLAGLCTYDGSWWLRSLPVTRHTLSTLAVSREFPVVQCWDAWPGSAKFL